MIWSPLRAILAVAIFATPLQAAPVELGKQFVFKDWVAACDNTLACEAISLTSEETGEPGPTIVISRGSEGDGAVEVKMSLAEPKGDSYRIRIDNRLAYSGMLAKGEWSVSVQGNDALRLARAIGRGRKLVVEGGDGAILGQTTLSGSAAALIHIDSIQNRARTRTALFAVGRRMLRPKSEPMPVILADRIGKQDAVPDTGAIVSVVESTDCAEARFTVTEDTAYSLGRRDGRYRVLVMVSCGSGAYNMSFLPLVGSSTDGKKWNFEPARFDYPDKPDDRPGGGRLLMNVAWDAENQQLSSYYKGRGLGDCGSAETYVWDGAMFRLVKAYAMDECRGASEWMTLWRAKVEFR